MRPLFAVLFATPLLAAAPALAQTAGHYQGLNNEGDRVDVYVAAKGDGFVVSAIGDAGAVTCGMVPGGTWRLQVAGGYHIGGGAASVAISQVDVFYRARLSFSGAAVTGQMLFGVPEFVTTAKHACASTTQPQGFSARYIGTDTVPDTQSAAMRWRLN